MRRYGRLKVALPGEEYVWEPDEMTNADMQAIEDESGGLSFSQWILQINEARPRACQTLIWFLRYKNGQMQERAGVVFQIRQLEITDYPEAEASETETGISDADTSSTSSGTSESTPPTGTP